MKSRVLGAFLTLVVFSSQSLALDVAAKLRRIDVDKREAEIIANGHERVVMIDNDAIVLF